MTTQTTMLGVPELTPEPPKPETPRTCRECVHFEPSRNPDTNRVLPSQKGMCVWRPEIRWALSYLLAAACNYGAQPTIQFPSRMWPETGANACVQFKRKE